MKIYNSLSRKLEDFKPLKSPYEVGFYSCGMTVYDYTHIGHGRKYVNDDVLRRVLEFNNYKVKFVQNVTDVGHLTSDADEGEDKLEKGASKKGKTVWEVAKFFEDHFYKSMAKLNIQKPDIICRATDHIQDQIDLIQKLIDKGHAYDTPEAVYFDIKSFPKYGELFGQSLDDKKTAVRQEVETGAHKKDPLDFALWFKIVGRFKNHVMHWNSPWGDGFPGWHIECSAMSMKYLGDQFDIHTGGEDHLSIHHPNEIAQAECATGKFPFAKYWMHTIFLTVDGTKMGKSLNNFYTIEDVEAKHISPLALRYFYLSAHYRRPLNFTWEALENAQNSLNNLSAIIKELKAENSDNTERTDLSEEKLNKIDDYKNRFSEAINNDLNMPQALAVTWEVAKSNIPSTDKLDLLLLFDEVLGLNFSDIKVNSPNNYPPELQKALDERQKVRAEGDYKKSDELRLEIEQKYNVIIKDTSGAPIIESKK